MTIHRIYLAGPDVFRPDAAAYGRRLVALCAEYGFEGIFPLLETLPQGLAPAALARHIYEANIAHIDRCDAVLAHLDFFRGPEPDSGTCFEVGYAVARGKPVWGYVPEDGALLERIRARHPQALRGFRHSGEGVFRHSGEGRNPELPPSAAPHESPGSRPSPGRREMETDAQGWQVEEFGLPLNLMLAVPARIVVGDARAALAEMREAFRSPAPG